MDQKTLHCSECGYEVDVPIKVERKHCIYDGHIMEEVEPDV